MYACRGCGWNSPGTPLITSTINCNMHTPSSLSLDLLQFSLAPCSYCFPLSLRVCCNKQLPELWKSRTSHSSCASLHLPQCRRTAVSGSAASKANQTKPWDSNEVMNVRVFENCKVSHESRATAKGKQKKPESVGADKFFLSYCLLRQVQPVCWVIGISFPALLKPKFSAVPLEEGVN